MKIVANIVKDALIGGASKKIESGALKILKHFGCVELILATNTRGRRHMLEFLHEHVVVKNLARSFVLRDLEPTQKTISLGRVTMQRNTDPDETPDYGTGIGYGPQVGMYRNRIVILNAGVPEPNGSGGYHSKVSVRFLLGTPKLVEQFVRDVTEYAVSRERTDVVKIHTFDSNQWIVASSRPKRDIDSIFLPGNVVERILSRIREWEESKEELSRKGLPDQLGILLHGEPGTAKTSLIHAIASHLGKHILYHNAQSMRDESTFMAAIRYAARLQNAISVLEDIDVNSLSTATRDKAEEKPRTIVTSRTVSMTSVLNSLDGFTTPPGMLTIATTNHLDHIDPAIVRPGRFDLVVEVGRIGRLEFEAMALSYGFDPTEYDLDHFTPMTGAHLRNLLLEGGVAAVRSYQLTA